MNIEAKRTRGHKSHDRVSGVTRLQPGERSYPLPFTMGSTEPRHGEDPPLLQRPADFAGAGNDEGLHRRRVAGGNNIFVRRSAGEVITLERDRLETVADVKTMIYEKECIHPTLQRLMFGRRLLHDNRSLAEYNIEKGSTIHLLKTDLGDGKGKNSIFVKKLTGDIIMLKVELSETTVAYARGVIAEKSGILQAQQHLVFHGRPLDDSNTLANYGIKESSVLHLAPGQRGGNGPPEMDIMAVAAHCREPMPPNVEGKKIVVFRMLNGRKFTLELDLSKTIAGVKDMIYDKEGIPPEGHYFVFGGQKLDDVDRTLADYNVRYGSSLLLMLRLRGGAGVYIFVKKITGEIFRLGVLPTCTIFYVMHSINSKEGIHWTQQHLVFEGQPLDNDRTLADYNIRPESTLHLALGPSGASDQHEGEPLLVQIEQATAASAAAAEDEAGQGDHQLPSGGSAPVDGEGSSEQVRPPSGEPEEQPTSLLGRLASLLAKFGHGTGTLANQEECWSKYSRKVLVFAISMAATYYVGAASTTSFSTGEEMAFKIAIGAFFIADATLSILMPPKWSIALVYLSWLLLEIVSCLLLVSFSKYYVYAILPVPLPIVVALLQLKLKPEAMQPGRARQNGDVENAEQDQDINREDIQRFDRIFELSGDIVNCGGIITVIFGNSIVGPASALGFLFFYTIALGLYLMMITTVRTMALIPHAKHLDNLLKVLLVITLITALIHGVSR
ncbi:hypothetical protein ACP4OV_026811 [Aristida adscensionis]